MFHIFLYLPAIEHFVSMVNLYVDETFQKHQLNIDQIDFNIFLS